VAAGAAQGRPGDDPEKYIVNPIDPSLPREEKVDRLQELSRENEPIVDRLIKRIDAELGTESKFSHKEREKIIEKAQRPSILAEKPWHDVEHIRDGFRFKTVVSRFSDIQRAFEILLDEGIGVVKIDTKKMIFPKEWGWRFAGFDLRMPNGQIVEWYLPLKELEAVKDGNHKIFEKWRNLTEEQINEDYDAYERDQEKSRSVYAEAFDVYLKREGLDSTAAEAAWAKLEASLVSMIGSKESISSSAEGMPRVQTPFLNITEKASHLTQTRPLSGSRETLIPSMGTSTESILLPESEVNDEEILFQETDEIRKQYEGTDQWMKAPNGKSTNLNESQYTSLQTMVWRLGSCRKSK
jgi:hypothetical protein